MITYIVMFTSTLFLSVRGFKLLPDVTCFQPEILQHYPYMLNMLVNFFLMWKCFISAFVFKVIILGKFANFDSRLIVFFFQYFEYVISLYLMRYIHCFWWEVSLFFLEFPCIWQVSSACCFQDFSLCPWWSTFWSWNVCCRNSFIYLTKIHQAFWMHRMTFWLNLGSFWPLSFTVYFFYSLPSPSRTSFVNILQWNMVWYCNGIYGILHSSASLTMLKPLPVDHNKLWKTLKEIGDHLTCLLRKLYAGWEATVRIGHRTTD